MEKIQRQGLRSACICSGLLACVMLGTAHAAAPSLKYFYPAGAARGMTKTISFSGTFDGTERRVWTSTTGLQFQPSSKAGTLDVTVSKDAPLGPCLVRLINSEGASKPLWFSVGNLPEIEDKEPNDELGKEQLIEKLPVTVDGKLEKSGTADLYAFELKAGQTITALVEAYSIGSAVDPALELRDASGTTVATAHDDRNLDPTMRFTTPKAGRYSLQLAGYSHPPAANVAFVGGANIVYRLHLTTGPVTTGIFPPAASTASKTAVRLTATGIPEKEGVWNVEPASLRAGQLVQRLQPPHAITPFQLAIVDTPIDNETEPNDTLAQAQPLAVPSCAAGTILKAGDVDLFAFRGTKGKSYSIEVVSKRIGLPLDARLTVMDAKGSEISSSDDGGEGDDSSLIFKASADGFYLIKVTDLFGKGSDSAHYALILKPGGEPLSATITGASEYSIKTGQTVEIKGKMNAPLGYSGELVARVHGLPADVSANEVSGLKKNGQEFTLTLHAAPDAAPGSYPLSVSLWPTDSKMPWRRATATVSLRGEDQRFTSLVDTTDTVFLTVSQSPHTAAKIEVPAPKRSELTPAQPPSAPAKK